MRPAWRMAAVCLFTSLISCGGGGPGTGPPQAISGEVTLVLSGSGTTDGALLLRISGGPVDAIAPVGPVTTDGAPLAGGAQFRAVVTGNLANGDLARIRVPDVAAAGAYTVVIEQVADRNTFALLDPAGRSVTVRR